MKAALDSWMEGAGRALWTPRPRPNCREWVEQNVVMGPFSRRPGLIDLDYTPYMREPHEWFSDRKIRKITGCLAIQVGKTTLMANCGLYAVAVDPGPVLWVHDTAMNAQSWSEREWMVRVEMCEAVRRLKPSDPDCYKKKEMQFRTCTFTLVGAQSEGNLKGRPIKYLFGDEVEEWPPGAIEEADGRLSSFRDIGKRVMSSTPKMVDGPIWRELEAGDNRRFMVPCPKCGHRQELVWKSPREDQRGGVKWPQDLKDLTGHWDLDGVEAEAYYECCNPECFARIGQGEIKLATRHGAYEPTNLKAPKDHRSFHVSALVSPTESIGGLAKEYLKAVRSEDSFRKWLNNREARPWEPRVGGVTMEALLAMRDPALRLRECPADPCMVTVCADPGERETYWTAQAWTQAGESWLLDYGTVLQPENLIRLIDEKEWQFPGGRMKAACGLVDSGDFTDRVYQVCHGSGGRLWPSKGSPTAFGTWGQSTLKHFPQMFLYTYSDFSAKCALYLDRIARRVAPLWHWPADIGQDFIMGHAGQTIIEQRAGQASSRKWKEIRGDHYGDCSKLHQICWWILGQNFSADVPAPEAPPSDANGRREP